MNRSDRKHVPMRTCVGCRKRAAKNELVRVARAPNIRTTGTSAGTSAGTESVPDIELVVDSKMVMPGRGAYVHNTPVCVNRALDRGGLARSFRRRVRVPNQALFLRDRGVAEAGATEKKGQS